MSVLHDATVTWLGKLVVLHVLCVLIWPWPPPRSRSRSRSVWTSENCPLLHISRSISSATFAYSSKVMLGGDSMGPRLQPVGARFWNFHLGSHYRNLTKFKWPYFGSAWRYSHMVEHAGSPTHTVYADVTLTWSKVKVKVTDHLNFRQLPITAHF